MLDIVQLALLDEAVIAVIIHEVLKGLQYLHEQVCSSLLRHCALSGADRPSCASLPLLHRSVQRYRLHRSARACPRSQDSTSQPRRPVVLLSTHRDSPAAAAQSKGRCAASRNVCIDIDESLGRRLSSARKRSTATSRPQTFCSLRVARSSSLTSELPARHVTRTCCCDV